MWRKHHIACIIAHINTYFYENGVLFWKLNCHRVIFARTSWLKIEKRTHDPSVQIQSMKITTTWEFEFPHSSPIKLAAIPDTRYPHKISPSHPSAHPSPNRRHLPAVSGADTPWARLFSGQNEGESHRQTGREGDVREEGGAMLETQKGYTMRCDGC